MMTTVRVIDRVTLGLRRLAVPAVVQALFTAARPVTDAVLEQIVAVDALSDCRTVAIYRHIVAALERVVVTHMRVAFLLYSVHPHVNRLADINPLGHITPWVRTALSVARPDETPGRNPRL